MLLALSFLICVMDMIIVPTSLGCFENLVKLHLSGNDRGLWLVLNTQQVLAAKVVVVTMMKIMIFNIIILSLPSPGSLTENHLRSWFLSIFSEFFCNFSYGDSE